MQRVHVNDIFSDAKSISRNIVQTDCRITHLEKTLYQVCYNSWI
jgi:hypothetical protein